MRAAIEASALTFILLVLLATQHVEGSPLLQKRVGPTFAAPSGWKVSWNVNKRVSTGASTSFITSSVIDRTATAVTQAHLNACVAKCSTTAKCGFVDLVKQTGATQGTVICLLYPHYLASTSATYTTAALSTSGTVDYSYGIRSLCAPTNGGALTCTPAVVSAGSISPSSTPASTTKIAISTTASISTTKMAVSTTTTTTTSALPTISNAYFITPSDNTLPAAPAGATLVEWKPCFSSLRNPAMLNDLAIKGSSSVTTAYISQHGAGSDFDAFFTSLYNLVGNTYPLISAGFMTDDGRNAFYRKGINLAWGSAGDSWTVGQDDTTGATCSSYDQYDSMINYYVKSGKFPNLNTLYLVGHSGGGNFISRFSTINTNNPVTIKYVVANAASQAWFTDVRPNATASTCTGAQSYPYQWTGPMPRYVASRFSDASTLFRQWIARPVVFLVGDLDTSTDGTQNCQSTSQGGSYRRDRDYAYWAYQNILAGTGTDVSQYTGYASMIAQGASQIASGSFNHQECTVAGVAHTVDAIYQSSCGHAAILGGSLPAGAGASYPTT